MQMCSNVIRWKDNLVGKYSHHRLEVNCILRFPNCKHFEVQFTCKRRKVCCNFLREKNEFAFFAGHNLYYIRTIPTPFVEICSVL